MSKLLVACLVETKASLDFLVESDDLWIVRGKSGAFGFQFIDLPAGARLVPIEFSGLHKQRT